MRRPAFFVLVSLSACMFPVSAFAGELNVAPLGTATQSSTGWGGTADRGNDGNTDGVFGNGSVTHTDTDGAPWWQVDLEEEYEISRIVLWNRTDCCSGRLTNFRVSILDAGLADLWSEDFFTDGLGFPSPDLEIVLDEPTSGQIVRVSLLPPQLADAFLLSLAEVQVFVDDAALPLLIAAQPGSGHVVAGRPFRFTVELLDPTGVSYQWKKEGTPMDGETEPTLSICRTAPADAGTYTVTATRGAESVTSDPAVLEVVDDNLAIFGVATQSSVGWDGLPGRANDGNVDGRYWEYSVTHTAAGDAAPWWQVELYGTSDIETIAIWNRTDDVVNRLSNFRVSVLDDGGAEVWGEVFFPDGTAWPDPKLEIPLPAETSGRTVRVDLFPPTLADLLALNLAEVEVLGTGPIPPPDPNPNLARHRFAAQSSTYPTYTAVRAIDGFLGSFSATASADDAASWELDLCEDTDVGLIVLHNRADCCGSRLRDVTVSVLDAARSPVYASDLLNPENELGLYPDGPPALTVDIQGETGKGARGRYVRVSRASDPDLSGTGGMGGTDESNLLSLAEVEVFPPLTCPAQGDTHCGGLEVEGPAAGGPGIHTLTATATDDSGDIILYTFTLEDEVRPPIVVGPGTASSVSILVPAGTWTATVEADDSTLCEDKAADATCSRIIEAPGDPENLAWQGAATQSSTGWDATADRGNDGVTDGAFWNGSVTHTLDADASPWWQVDLGGTYELDRIVLWNRADSCGTYPCGARLTNFRVSVLDDGGAEVWGEAFFTDGVGYPDPALGGFEIPLPEGTEGRTVHVQILGPNQVDAPVGTIAILSLAEVEVFRAGSMPEPKFHRGDPNVDGTMNITDGIFILNFLFLGGPKPGCMEAADPNDDGAVNITDGIYVLNHLFLGGPAPRAPGPPSQPCGPDPAGSPDVGCDAYESC